MVIKKLTLILGIIFSLTFLIGNVNAEIICYQEFANVSTACGGLATGTYTEGSNRDLLINYTKPFIVRVDPNYREHLWQVKHHIWFYNVSVPEHCFNAFPNTLALRMYSEAAGGSTQSIIYCQNSTGWFILNDTGVGASASSTQASSISAIYDGNYNTYVSNTDAGWRTHLGGTNSKLYEEALFWNITEFLENNQTFNEIALENSLENFEINITYDSSIYTSISASLIYNGTSYAGTQSGSGDTILFSSTIGVPSVTSDQNISFYWEIALYNGSDTSYHNSTFNNQTVLDFSLDDCSVNTVLLHNFTLKDEETQTIINGTDKNASIEIDLSLSTFGTKNNWLNFSNTYSPQNFDPAQICANLNLSGTTYRTDLVASYLAEDLVKEFYYIDNGTILNSSIPQNIDFLDLALADSTTFLFTYLGEDNLEIPNAVVHVYRYYIGEGLFKEVERAKQDDNGETHLHLVEEDVIYYFRISVDSEILFTSSQYNAKCLSTPCQIELEGSPDFEEFDIDWDLMPGGSFTVSEDDTLRKVTLAFTSTTSVTMNLTVAKQDYSGDLEVIGSQQVTANSGTLSVTVPLSAGNVTYYAIVYRDGEYIYHRLVDFMDNTAYYGNTGRALGFLTIIALVLMGATEGLLLFVFLVLALLLVSALALMKLSYYALIGFICAVAILIWKLIKRGRRAV